jgi:hypothetical protein
MKYLFFFLFLSTFSFGQCCSALDSLHEKHTSYKVQVLSASSVDKTKFIHFIKDYRCEVEHHKTKVGKDVYRYLITPKENNLESANVLLDEVSRNYQNPFIIVYYKGKRQN